MAFRLKPTILLLILCLGLYLPGMFSIPLMDRDSAHFAQATKQMLETGNYFQIRFQDKTRYQKPPGINWLQAASIKIFSHLEIKSAWPYRIPSLLGGLISVLMLYFFVKKLINWRVAFYSSCLLACSLLLTIESHLAVIDASLLSSVVLMQGALWIIYNNYRNQQPQSTYWIALFWLAMAYGFLLKGVTPLVGFLTIGFLSLIDNNLKWTKVLKWHWGILFLLMSCLWLVMVSINEHSNYLLQMFYRDLLPKLKGGHESHGQIFGFHLAILPLMFWPGSIFLWQSFIHVLHFYKSPIERFLMAWIIPTWIFFEIMPTKLPQYTLPTFPALSVLAVLSFCSAEKVFIRGKHWVVLRVLYLLWLLMALVFAVFFIALAFYIQPSSKTAGILIASIISLGSIVMVVYAFKRQPRKMLAGAVCTSVLAYALTFQLYLPSFSSLWVSQNIYKRLVENRLYSLISPQHPVLSIGYDEPSLVFYLGTHSVKFTNINQISTYFAQGSPSFLIVDAQYKSQVDEQTKPLDIKLELISSVEGINYNKGKKVNLLIYKTLNQ